MKTILAVLALLGCVGTLGACTGGRGLPGDLEPGPYLTSKQGVIYAIEADGHLTERARLKVTGPISTLVIGRDGKIYTWIPGEQDEIQVFDRHLKMIRRIRPREFRHEYGSDGFWGKIAIGTDGNILVLHVGRDRASIYELDPTGRVLKKFNTERLGRGALIHDSKGDLYHAGRLGRKVWKYDSEGDLISAFILPPVRNIIDSVFSENDNLLILSSPVSAYKGMPARPGRLTEVALSGQLGDSTYRVVQIVEDPELRNLSYQSSVAIDKAGNLYIYSFEKLLIYNPERTLVKSITIQYPPSERPVPGTNPTFLLFTFLER